MRRRGSGWINIAAAEVQARKAKASAKPEYSYERESFRPLGLQWFLEKVRPRHADAGGRRSGGAPGCRTC